MKAHNSAIKSCGFYQAQLLLMSKSFEDGHSAPNGSWINE